MYGIICFGMGLTLREGNREYFYKQLDKLFPHLKDRYVENYKDSYSVISRNNKYLMSILYRKCKESNIICNADVLFEYMHTFPQTKDQLSLF